jgi:hypothetical protein
MNVDVTVLVFGLGVGGFVVWVIFREIKAPHIVDTDRVDDSGWPEPREDFSEEVSQPINPDNTEVRAPLISSGPESAAFQTGHLSESFFYLIEGRVCGRASVEQLNAWAAEGKFKRTDLVRRNEESEWQPAIAIPEICEEMPPDSLTGEPVRQDKRPSEAPSTPTKDGSTMSDSIFYAIGKKRHGPASVADLRELVAKGEFRRTDRVWRDGMANWQAATAIPEIFAGLPPDFGENAGLVPPPLPEQEEMMQEPVTPKREGGRRSRSSKARPESNPWNMFGE